MIIGLPKEIKNNENRVALTPSGVNFITKNGHKVLVEQNAGVGSGYEDVLYITAGAEIVSDKADLFSRSDLIIKVKEPLESEYELFKEGQILFAYLHMAPNLPLANALMRKKVTSIAYETVQLSNGTLPLLSPMSEIAGRMSVQIGASLLQKNNGGMGILLGGIPGVSNAHVAIIGAGVVGTNAAKMALGLGARVTVLDINKARLVYLDDIFSGHVSTLICNEINIENTLIDADLLIGAVLVTGARAPKIVKETTVMKMKKGSVIVDVSIDQGGSIETIDHVTTYDNPSYEKHGVIHYSVANIPGAVPRTSTIALESATLPFLMEILDNGVEKALLNDPSLLHGLNTYKGKITCEPVANGLGFECTNPREMLIRL